MQVNQQRAAWYALVMMAGVIVFACTHGFVEWGSAAVAAFAFYACVTSLRFFTSADEQFLARNGMTGDTIITSAKVFNTRPDDDGPRPGRI